MRLKSILRRFITLVDKARDNSRDLYNGWKYIEVFRQFAPVCQTLRLPSEGKYVWVAAV